MACFGVLRNCLDHGRPVLRSFCSTSKSAPVAMPALGTTPKTKDGAVELYDKWVDSYDATLRSWDYPAPRRTAQLLRQYIDQRQKESGSTASALPILDAGCGTGLSGAALFDLGFKDLVGTDVSSLSIDHCREKNIYSDLHVCDLECSEGPTPFADDSFAGITCVGVFSYVQRFDRVFEEWSRILAPGGLVVFTHQAHMWDGNVHNIQTAAMSSGWRLLFQSDPEAYMPKNPDPKENAKRIRYLVYATE